MLTVVVAIIGNKPNELWIISSTQLVGVESCCVTVNNRYCNLLHAGTATKGHLVQDNKQNIVTINFDPLEGLRINQNGSYGDVGIGNH